jgi:hypothetical protein
MMVSAIPEDSSRRFQGFRLAIIQSCGLRWNRLFCDASLQRRHRVAIAARHDAVDEIAAAFDWRLRQRRFDGGFECRKQQHDAHGADTKHDIASQDALYRMCGRNWATMPRIEIAPT